MTVKGFDRLHNLHLTDAEINRVGIALSKYCRENGIAMDWVRDRTWGRINAYRMDVLESWRDSRLVATR